MLNLKDRVVTIIRFGDDSKILFFFKETANAGADNGMIVSQNYSNGFGHI
jgi:hypothetical protein